jgi:hypothetical protein
MEFANANKFYRKSGGIGIMLRTPFTLPTLRPEAL